MSVWGKKISLMIATLSGLVLLLLPSVASAAAPVFVADAKSNVCQGIGGCPTGGDSALERVIGLAVNVLTIIGGIAAVIMIIVAGIRYINSGGDASKTASAKNALLYAVIGLVVIGMAQIVVRFVIDKAE